MQILSLRNYQIFLRAAVFIGVLAGLLVSSGEGIRLFPFPPAEITLNRHSKLKSGEGLDYQKNVHRFENNQGNYQSKVKRNSDDHSAGNYNLPTNATIFAPTGEISGSYINSHSVKTTLFASALKSRAPPFS